MNNESPYNIVQSNEIIELLKNPDVIDFIDKHYGQRPESLALRFSKSVDFNLSKLTQILQLYMKAWHKIPAWVENRCALDHKSYAQCTHAQVAEFKAGLFSGKRFLDMTSGLGVDSYFFSKNFESVISLEKNLSTLQFAQFNAPKLGITNIQFINSSCEEYYLDQHFDLIYLDPDRRPDSSNQVRKLEEYSPNVFELQHSLLKKAPDVLIKLSPMIDLNYLENRLINLVRIYVISFKNEVKEVLAHLSIKQQTIERFAVDITATGTAIFTSDSPTEHTASYQSSGAYLIEPLRSIIKAGLSRSFAIQHDLKFLSEKGLYFFSDQYNPDLPARQFQILEKLDFSWKGIAKFLKSNGIKAINIAQRNFFEDVRTIRQRLKVNEGGDLFLFFSTDNEGKAVCYYAKPC